MHHTRQHPHGGPRRTAVTAAAAAAAAALILLPAGSAQAAGGASSAPAAAKAAAGCSAVSTVGRYCGYHAGTAWAQRGSTGAHVREIQALINETTRFPQASGKRLAVDGIYGPATETAVEWFQWYYIGVSASDGIVGPQTWEELRYGKR
ncbi:peptidoglycan-binding domain-containing protein [Streptomyces poriticola]|uniref:peptidoglycan-binding domain-containing protein n=1 Tax=Streptomyces poriticola TaxID=3120506 RepID=UPI002FCE3FE2